jgi:alpha-glucosidase
MLLLYRRLIHQRKTSRALSQGSYRSEATAPEDCLVFHREVANQRVIVALNFSNEPRRIEVPRASILLSTDRDRGAVTVDGTLDLAPNEAVILAVA